LTPKFAGAPLRMFIQHRKMLFGPGPAQIVRTGAKRVSVHTYSADLAITDTTYRWFVEVGNGGEDGSR
jgi:hypothetical protein